MRPIFCGNQSRTLLSIEQIWSRRTSMTQLHHQFFVNGRYACAFEKRLDLRLKVGDYFIRAPMLASGGRLLAGMLIAEAFYSSVLIKIISPISARG